MAVTVNAYCTHRAPPALNFAHQLNSQRNLSDPQLVPHLNGFAGYVAKQGGEMTQPLYHLIRHIQRVQTQISFDVEDEFNFAQLQPWALAANAVLFLPDGTVRDPGMLVLLAPGGHPPDDGAELPYPSDALERRARTTRQLAKLGLEVPAMLPPVISETEVDFRAPGEVALRALSLLVCAVRAESLATGDPIPLGEMQERMPLAFEAMTPNEAEFMHNQAPPQQDVVSFSWRYEALFVLEWALGLVDKFSMPTALCDVPLVARTMMEADAEELVATAALRPAGKLLDALDAHFRLHWLARQAALDGRTPPGKLDQGIIQERHYALNWLIRFEGADWDDIDTPT